LNEEKEADRTLNDLAENIINEEAAEGDSAPRTSASRAGAPKTRTAGGH
jgi:hypothetical protein